MRPAGHRPAADPRPDHARLRHHRADPEQRAGPDATTSRSRPRRSTSPRWPSRRSRRSATPRSASTAAAWTSRPSATHWRSSRRGAARPDLRERAGPAADVPAHVQGVRRRHRRPLRAGPGLVDLQRRSHEHVQPELLDPQDAGQVPGPLRGGARVPAGPGAGDLALDRRDDDLARAAAGVRRRARSSSRPRRCSAPTSCTTSSSFTRSAAATRPRRSSS